MGVLLAVGAAVAYSKLVLVRMNVPGAFLFRTSLCQVSWFSQTSSDKTQSSIVSDTTHMRIMEYTRQITVTAHHDTTHSG